MKSLTISYTATLLLLLLVAFNIKAQNVGISLTGSTPHTSAGLDVDFSDKGFLAPRMTSAQRDAIVNPARGLIIFNTDTDCPNYYANGFWYANCGLMVGTFASWDCGTGATHNGTLYESISAMNVNSAIPYTGKTACFTLIERI